MWWSRGQMARPDDEPTVAGECEAFTAGRYAEAAEGWGWPVPIWSWANVLAHRTDEELRAMAVGRVDWASRRAELAPWHDILRSLAVAVFAEAARAGAPVEEVQADILIPLEARLIDGEGYQPLTPEQFGSLVLATLRRHPSSCT